MCFYKCQNGNKILTMKMDSVRGDKALWEPETLKEQVEEGSADAMCVYSEVILVQTHQSAAVSQRHNLHAHPLQIIRMISSQ